MKLDQLLPIPDLEAAKRVLFVQPHPDDNEVGAGATVAKLAASGCEVSYLTVTDGSLGTTDAAVRRADLAATRVAETARAAAILGVKRLYSLGVPDGSWPQAAELARDIGAVIRAERPELVVTCDPFLPYEAHPDHRSVGMAVLEACLFCGFPHFETGPVPRAQAGAVDVGAFDPASPWSISGVALYHSAAPNTYVRVDATWERKFEALAAHESQFPPELLAQVRPYFELKAAGHAIRPRFLSQGLGRYLGAILSTRKGGARAEAFKVLSPTHLHCFVDTALGDFQAPPR